MRRFHCLNFYCVCMLWTWVTHLTSKIVCQTVIWQINMTIIWSTLLVLFSYLFEYKVWPVYWRKARYQSKESWKFLGGPKARPPLHAEGLDRFLIPSQKRYSSPSILQPSSLRPPLIIRPLDLVPKGQFSVLNYLYFKTTCNTRPHFLGPLGGLKIEGPLYPQICLRLLSRLEIGEALYTEDTLNIQMSAFMYCSVGAITLTWEIQDITSVGMQACLFTKEHCINSHYIYL